MATLDNTLGALFFGVLVAASLFGFTLIQTWYYFSQYSSDPWYLKFLVATVLVLDTCHQILITHTIYTYVITNFGVGAELDIVVWSLAVQVFFNAFITFIVQCFLVMRVYALSNQNRFATGVVMIFVIANFVATFVFSVKCLPLNTFVKFATLNDLSMAVNGLSAAADIILAGSLCYLLQVSRTGFRKSDTLITKLMVFTINTGLLTSLCALASLICINAWPGTWIYIGFYFCIGRLYCNSLLATLNARKRLKAGSPEDDTMMSLHGQTQQKTTHTMIGNPSGLVPNNISIKIDTTHEYIRDEFSSSNVDLKTPEVD